MARGTWASLSGPYRQRLERSGIGREAYESGASLSGARGHGATPERPGAGAEKPEYRPYYELRKEINTLKKEIFGHEVGRASLREMSKKGKAALTKARDYLAEMKRTGNSWDAMIASYPELASDKWDWIRHYH